MFLKEISFVNARSLFLKNISLNPKTTIIVGENGSGKTTILEAISYISTAKSFRKKHNQSIIKKGQKEIQIQATTNNEKKIKIIFNGKNKKITINEKRISKTTTLMEHTDIIYISPEETDVIESYKNEKQKYFDRIIFKINKKHIEKIKNYKKILLYRNTLLENNMDTKPWDKKITEEGIAVWKNRNNMLKKIQEKIKEASKEINIKNEYSIVYKTKQKETEKEYIKELNKSEKKTEFGPHKDNIEFFINNISLKEHGSQGEKKLFKYLLKIAESKIIIEEKEKPPIILLDDFFAKLDMENIMKIFTYFHRKFQVIITTTEIKEKALQTTKEDTTIISLDD